MAPQEAYESYMQGLGEIAVALEKLRDAWPKMAARDRRSVLRANGDLEALTGEANIPDVLPALLGSTRPATLSSVADIAATDLRAG